MARHTDAPTNEGRAPVSGFQRELEDVAQLIQQVHFAETPAHTLVDQDPAKTAVRSIRPRL